MSFEGTHLESSPIVAARGARKTYDTGAVRVDALRGVRASRIRPAEALRYQ